MSPREQHFIMNREVILFINKGMQYFNIHNHPGLSPLKERLGCRTDVLSWILSLFMHIASLLFLMYRSVSYGVLSFCQGLWLKPASNAIVALISYYSFMEVESFQKSLMGR